MIYNLKRLLQIIFFSNVHRLDRGKFHLHHSHITSQIYGYAHDFCNMTLIEKSTPEIPFVANKVFGFDSFYYIKAYIASAWCTKLFQKVKE